MTITLAGAACALAASERRDADDRRRSRTRPPPRTPAAGFSVATIKDTAPGSPAANIDIFGPATALTIVPASGTPAPGAADTLTLTAVDAGGRTVATYTGDKILTFSGANNSTNPATTPTVTDKTATPVNFGTATTITFTNGVATAGGVMKLYKVESPTVAVGDGTLSGNASLVVGPATASRLVVTGTGAQTAGASQTATVTAMDPYGNTDTGYTGNHTLTFTGANSSSSPVTSPTFRDRLGVDQNFGAANTSLTFTSGVASGLLKLYKVETALIVANDGTITSAGGDRLSVAVSAGAVTKLALTGTPASVTAGNTGSVTVTAQDAYGNTNTGYLGTVHFTSTDGAAVLPANYTFVAGDNGVHTFTNAYTLKTAGSRTLTGTDTVTGTITGTSAAITVNPAAATTLTLTATPASVTAGTTASVTVTALDAFGNTATGYLGTVHFTSTDAAAVLPANYTFVAGDAGVHTFTNAYTLKTAGSRTLTGTDTVTGTITGTSAAITVNPAAAATLALSGTPALGHRRQHRLGHRHRARRLRQHRDRLHAASSTSPRPTAPLCCRATTPSPAATRASTRSRTCTR